MGKNAKRSLTPKCGNHNSTDYLCSATLEEKAKQAQKQTWRTNGHKTQLRSYGKNIIVETKELERI